MELVASSSLVSNLIFGGGGGGGGLMEVVMVGEDVDDETIPPVGIRNSFLFSVLKIIVEVCMVWLAGCVQFGANT